MIRRKPLIATAIIASVVLTACSDMTAPKNDPGVLPAAAIPAPHPVGAADREGNRRHVTVVATIKGRGKADMVDPIAAGKTVFSFSGVKLLSDGSAKGDVICEDTFLGATPLGRELGYPGIVSAKMTSWSKEGTVIVLKMIGTVVPLLAPDGHRGTPQPVALTVKIYKFGGAGVSYWTMEDTPSGFIFCYELLTSGRIVYRPHVKTGREDDD